jgi:hypothetical protein
MVIPAITKGKQLGAKKASARKLEANLKAAVGAS